MAKKAKRRRYSDDDRASALAALAANGGNLARTSAALGIPEATLRQWATGKRHPEAVQMSDQKKAPLADAIEGIARQIADSLPGKLPDADLKDASIAFGVLIDKMRLLRGEPTSIDEQRDSARLAEFRKRYGNPAADAAADAGVDGGAQPVRPPPAD